MDTGGSKREVAKTSYDGLALHRELHVGGQMARKKGSACETITSHVNVGRASHGRPSEDDQIKNVAQNS